MDEERRKLLLERQIDPETPEDWEIIAEHFATVPPGQPDNEAADLAAEEAAIDVDAEALRLQRDLDRELAKFTANALDRMSTSLLTLGLIGPGVGFLYHTSILATLTNSELVVATISCLGVSFVLHSVGRAVLSEVFLR